MYEQSAITAHTVKVSRQAVPTPPRGRPCEQTRLPLSYVLPEIKRRRGSTREGSLANGSSGTFCLRCGDLQAGAHPIEIC